MDCAGSVYGGVDCVSNLTECVGLCFNQPEPDSSPSALDCQLALCVSLQGSSTANSCTWCEIYVTYNNNTVDREIFAGNKFHL